MKHITLDAVDSSQIAAIGYDAETQTLAIRFKGKGEKPGSVYHYSGFSPEDWQAFREAESVGSHFYRHIKPFDVKYPYVRVEPAKTEQA